VLLIGLQVIDLGFKPRYYYIIKETAVEVIEPTNTAQWTPDSWRSRPVAQAIDYDDQLALEQTCSQLRKLPPLVLPYQIEGARQQLYQVAKGNAFIIQGGDCAESFYDVQHNIIRSKVTLLAYQSQILGAALGKSIIQIGRIAGQYAKPRSQMFERLPTGETVPAFRGHNVNSENPESREPDPQRLQLGYFYAAATLNTITQVEKELSQGARNTKAPPTLYTSHEILHLPYESALTTGVYNTSATFLWLGERTRQLDGAHVEYARGLRNPIGVKIGPTATPAAVVALLDTLSQNRDHYGKISLITRLGWGKVHSTLPQIIRAVQLSGHVPIWICDPCHANTVSTTCGRKTGIVNAMLGELKETYVAHRRLGSHLGGIHLEQTGENVTECFDEVHVVEPADLGRSYRSLCDPRLSADQAIDLVKGFTAFVKEWCPESGF